MKSKQELTEKLKSDKMLSLVFEALGKVGEQYKFTLTGGAVVDILLDRGVKDYDFVFMGEFDEVHKEMQLNGFFLKCVTQTAYTYTFGGLIVQILKTKLSSFDFTISTSTYNPSRGLDMDWTSFESKVLVPQNFTRLGAIKCLARTPHWETKGFTLPEMTFKSLMGLISKEEIEES